MGKYKVCPSCGKHNLPTLMECIGCETDLTSVKVVDEQTEKINDAANNEREMVRICDCGTENSSSARKCTDCGEDISDIIPIAKSKSGEQIPLYALVAVNDDFTFTIANDTTIGREQKMSEHLSSKTYVSRTHAKLTIINNELFLTNLSATNFTYVNNKKIPNDSSYLLHDGDEIGLGGFLKNGQRQENAAYFIVRICQCM